jgi:ribonuclease HI
MVLFCKEHHEGGTSMVHIFIDGASAGDPGPSGAGILIQRQKGIVEKYSIPLGTLTSHEAEFYALIQALRICVQTNTTIVSFKTDSQLVHDSVEKKFVKNDKYKPLLNEALTLIEQIELFFIKWIPTKQNKADQLAKEAIRLNEEEKNDE